jgi:hypothetical protein
MIDQERRHFAQAVRHIAKCKVLIARITERGQPTDWAEDRLRALESSLRAFDAHRKLIVAEIKAAR